MFSLIITIISIALVAALAIATIYYGGSAFTQGSAKASASTLVSHAQQVAGANTLYANDNGGTFTTNVADLTTGGYLASAPAAPSSVASGSYGVSSSNEVSITVTSTSVCEQVNKNISGTASVPAAKPAQQYGCWGDPAGTMSFFFQG